MLPLYIVVPAVGIISFFVVAALWSLCGYEADKYNKGK